MFLVDLRRARNLTLITRSMPSTREHTSYSFCVFCPVTPVWFHFNQDQVNKKLDRIIESVAELKKLQKSKLDLDSSMELVTPPKTKVRKFFCFTYHVIRLLNVGLGSSGLRVVL